MSDWGAGLPARVRATSLLVGSVVFLSLLTVTRDHAILLSLIAGFGLAWLLWWSAERVVELVVDESASTGRKLAAGALHVGKYAFAGLCFWALLRWNLLNVFALLGGFSIPSIVAMLKAVSWRALGEPGEARPFFLRGGASKR